MAVKIRLKRLGKIRAPYYRIVVADSRTKRDGRAIEEIGKYHPTEEPSFIEIDSERAQHWLKVGAQPTEQVAVLLKITGDWQKFKGLPGTEGTLRVAEPKPDKRVAFEAVAKESLGEPKADATTAKKKSAKKAAPKAEEPKVDEPKADDAKAEEPKADDAKAEEPTVDDAKAEEPKAGAAEAPTSDDATAAEPAADEAKA